MMKRIFLSFGFALVAVLLFSCKDEAKGEKAASVAEPLQAVAEVSKDAEVSKGVVLQLNYEGTLNMGTLYECEKRHSSFLVTNVSGIEQTITEVLPTCDCIKIEKDLANTVLQPGESMEVPFVMDAATVRLSLGSFGRIIQISTLTGTVIQARVGGYILSPLLIRPDREVELGLLKDPAAKWTHTFHLEVNPEMKVPLVWGEIPEVPYLNCVFEDKGDGKYDLTVTPATTLPYNRKFQQVITLPIVQPAEAIHLALLVTAQVGEAVNFAPDSWKIVRSKLEEAGQFTERFAYGEVPGLQEEKNDGVRDLRNMMKKSLLRQHNAVPLKFVKENHDWDDLFAHLEYEVPAGVTLEKIRHPQGIELKITVTKEAFAETTSVQVVPFRDGNRCAPITIQMVD